MGSLRFYNGTNLGGKPRLSCIREASGLILYFYSMNQKLYKAKHHFIATEEETNFHIMSPFRLNLLLLKLKTED